MPYYVYKIFEFPFRRLEKLEQHDNYGEASRRSKLMRSELAPDATYRIKVIFADSELHAEDLLNELRAPHPNPDDD